jgi:hypothetical protein
MGLLSNGYRHMLKGRMLGATALDGANPSVLLNRFNQAAPIRNQFIGEGIASNYAAKPSGHLHPSAWMMPQKPGDMSSRNEAEIAFSTTASGVMGFPIVGSASFAVVVVDADILPLDDTSPLRTGSATITISVLDADGQLISSGSGSASIAVTTNTPILTASINGDGTTSFSITTNTPVLGAEASGEGTSSFSFSVSGSILPLDDASPLRTGTTTITISGALTPYAIGSMIGTTDVVTELTTDSIAAAVWNAISSSFNDAGTMGNKLNTASSGGVDMDALAQTVWEYALRSMPAAERSAIADAVWAKELP